MEAVEVLSKLPDMHEFCETLYRAEDEREIDNLIGEAACYLEIQHKAIVSLLARDAKCRCCNVGIGTYAAQITCELPFATPKFPDGGKFVGIDRCILPAVAALWNEGIQTIESCCGHGEAKGYIAVVPEHEGAMEALGYRRDPRAPHVFMWPPNASPAAPPRSE